jgi:hypothetical protein
MKRRWYPLCWRKACAFTWKYLTISDFFIVTVKQTMHEQFLDFKESMHWNLLVIRHGKLYMLKYHDIIIIMKINKNWIIMILFSKRYNDENLNWCDSEQISNANFGSFFNHKSNEFIFNCNAKLTLKNIYLF